MRSTCGVVIVIVTLLVVCGGDSSTLGADAGARDAAPDTTTDATTDASVDASQDAPACAAPACGGLTLPAQVGELSYDELAASIEDATVGVPDGGFVSPTGCGPAMLALRVSRLEVVHQGKQVWLPTGTLDGPPQTYYCLVQASDDAHIEIGLTTISSMIADNNGVDFDATDATFWGQTGPRGTSGDVTLTYDCFQQQTPGAADAWAAVLAAADVAADPGVKVGTRGWTFPASSVAAAGAVVTAAFDAAAQNGDWHLYGNTQTLDHSWLLELTNGHAWSFNEHGGEAAFQYPWSLTVHLESWGCASTQ